MTGGICCHYVIECLPPHDLPKEANMAMAGLLSSQKLVIVAA